MEEERKAESWGLQGCMGYIGFGVQSKLASGL